MDRKRPAADPQRLLRDLRRIEIVSETATPYRFQPHERPAFPGSPYSPEHSLARRSAYFVTGVVLGVLSTFPNALTTVNVSYVAGELHLFAAEVAALPAVYVAMNASANLTLVKARAQFGIPGVTVAMLCLSVIVGVAQFLRIDVGMALAMRAVSGMTAAALVTLSVYYLMQAMPTKVKPLGAVIGIGLPQIGTPLARLVPLDLLLGDHLWGLHALEVTAALLALALILAFPLPPSDRTRSFVARDVPTIVLSVIGLVLLCQVIGQGRNLWWSDTPWLGVALATAIAMLAAAFVNEVLRADPLVHFEWIGSLGIVRFAAVALLLRLALAEQTYGAVGLLSLAGLDNDQLHALFAGVALAMVLGIAAAALTLSERRIPWQVFVAALIISAGAWMDSGASALTRPSELMISQCLIGFGTTLFIGPALVYGFLQMIQRGGDYLVSFVVTFSITQNIGGLLGSAFLGSLQFVWSRNAVNALAADTMAADPLVAGRLAAGAQALASALVDPAARLAQSAALLGSSMNREAAIIAFTDTFRLVACLGLATSLFLLISIAMTRLRNPTRKPI